MKQTLATNLPATPAHLSPEFNTWIAKEKQEARLHRQRLYHAAVFILTGCILFLLKDQMVWVRETFDFGNSIANQ